MKYKYFLPITTLIVFIWALWNYLELLSFTSLLINLIMPFIVGCSLAFILNVPLVQIEKLWAKAFANVKNNFFNKLQRPFCLLLTIIFIIGLATIGILKVGPDIYQSFQIMAQTLPKASTKFLTYLQEYWTALDLSQENVAYLQTQWLSLLDFISNYWENNRTAFFYSTVGMTTSLISTLSNIVIGAVFAVYLLLNKEHLAKETRKAVFAFLAPQRANYVLKVSKTAYKIFSGYIGGQLLEAIALGLLCFVGMLILGLPHALSISVIVGMLAIIPIIGTIISTLLGLMLVGFSAPDKIWLFIVFFIILQRIEGDLLYPKIVGKSVGLSEIWVLVAITIGGSLGGILGIIVSVPIASIIAFIFSNSVQHRLAAKNLDQDSL